MHCPFCDSTDVEETLQDSDRIECLECNEFFYIDDVTDEDEDLENYLEED